MDTNKLANALLPDDFLKNSVIMYMLLKSQEFAFCYIVAYKTGTIGCPCSFRLSHGEIAFPIDDSLPEIFVYDE